MNKPLLAKLKGGPLDGQTHVLESPFGLRVFPAQIWLPDPHNPSHLLHYLKDGEHYRFQPGA